MPDAFQWDGRARRYRSTAGRFVPEKSVRQALDSVLRVSADNTRALGQQLVDGSLSVAEWQRAMAAEMKQAHLVAAVSAKGGWQQMSQADFGWVGQRLRQQYGYLQRFADQVAGGEAPLNGVTVTRSQLYGEAARGTNREMERRMARQGGQTWERNVLGDADHCDGCLEETSRGRVGIGELVPVGERDCLGRCKCHLEYGSDAGDAADDEAA